MREIMEMMHRTAMGVDQDYENITKQISRTALADGWGGSMVSTDISDILFGTPSPVEVNVDMGVLQEDQVNIIVHGHEPILLEAMMISVAAPSIKKMATDAGAKGINLVGMCCSGLDVMSRHGIPHAGNFSSTEAALVTGAVDAMTVDIQCIKQDLHKVAGCYDTVFITTNYRAKIEGAEHVELDEHDPMKCTDEIVIKAISRFKNRSMPIEIPNKTARGVHGFSHEYIKYMLGGSFRGGYEPLNDNIVNGRIRGVAGVVGCTNPRSKQDYSHVELVKELIKNDVLVVQTGCSQMALAKAGLTTPGAAAMAGPGLAEVCETVGIPPVLGLGSCVDNSRILMAVSEMVHTGGLGESIAELPVAGCAPEWMSEKAIAIGQYFVASGVFTVFGHTFPITRGTRFEKLLFEGLESKGFGKWGFADSPHEMARLMIEHIDKKRKELGIDKARERVLMDMSDRRSLAANE
jgi:carbon-monoxide dehydrogenase catalytic subunit